jgi:hypothetical protein
MNDRDRSAFEDLSDPATSGIVPRKCVRQGAKVLDTM